MPGVEPVEGYLISLLENEIIFSKGISGRRIFRQLLSRIFLQLELFDYKYKWTNTTQEVLLRMLPFENVHSME